MITLIVKVDIKQDNLFNMANFLAETIIAQTDTLDEDGCSNYSIYYDPDNANGYVLIETYFNEEAIEIHKTMPHYIEWRDNVQQYMNNPRQVTKLKTVGHHE